MSGGLKLLARDAAAVRVISAHMQDAILQIGDVVSEPQTRRFVLMANRYCWEAKSPMRVRSALVVEHVLAVRRRNIRREREARILSLMALDFTAQDKPAGELRLLFAGDGEIRIAVEACSIILEDVGTGWSVRRAPRHK